MSMTTNTWYCTSSQYVFLIKNRDNFHPQNSVNWVFIYLTSNTVSVAKTVNHNSKWRLTIPQGVHKSALGLDKIPKSVFDNLLWLLEDGIDETQTNESVPHAVSTNFLEGIWRILKSLITTLRKLGYTINQNVLSGPQTVSNIALN
jgi:hypothetical protein